MFPNITCYGFNCHWNIIFDRINFVEGLSCIFFQFSPDTYFFYVKHGHERVRMYVRVKKREKILLCTLSLCPSIILSKYIHDGHIEYLKLTRMKNVPE